MSAPGTGGLDVLRLTCSLRSSVGAGSRVSATLRDENFGDRVGWREMTAIGDRATLRGSDVPTRSISARLTDYPADLLQSPPDVRSAHFIATPGGAAIGAEPGEQAMTSEPGAVLGLDALSRRFAGLVAERRLSPGFLAFAVLLALVLGAAHTMAPGHGKTVMAAYLVGERGSPRQAAMIGLTVTCTHTVGVLILGLVLSTSTTLAPERLYPFLTIASGVLFGAIGVGLLRRYVAQRRRVTPVSDHDHEHHDHEHHDHEHHDHTDDHHDNTHPQHEVAASALVHSHGGSSPHSHVLPIRGDDVLGWRQLVMLGLAGGMVPTPSALVVLLGAIALGRFWLGFGLVLVYGVGMAATLTGVGLLLARARGRLEGRFRRPAAARWMAVMPALSAVVILGAGGIVARAASPPSDQLGYCCVTVLMSAKASSWGPMRTAMRPTPGTSNGSRMTEAPIVVALATAASVSSTAK